MNVGGCTRLALASVSAAILLLLSGCDSREDKAQTALAEFQIAQASGDLDAQQRALSKLVAADETNAQAWASLGQVQQALGLIPDAFNSYSRALDFDRDSPNILRALIGLSLRVGQLDRAEEYVEKLQIVAPGDSMVLLTRGLIALQRRDLDGADAIARQMIESGAGVSEGVIIKSQVQLRRGRDEEALALMESQLQSFPQDLYLLRAVSGLYEKRGDYSKSAQLRRRIWDLNRKDFVRGVEYTEAALKAGDTDGARAVAVELLTPGAPSWRIDQMTQAWRDWPGGAPVDLVMSLAQKAPPPQQLNYATYLNKSRRPEAAAAIAAPQAQGSVAAGNVRAYAIVAESLALRGQYQEARALTDKAIGVEPDNVAILRVKTVVELESKDYRAATNDARRLASLDTASTAPRLLLADTYLASGDREEAIRSLWQAFHDMPTDKEIYNRLRQLMLQAGQDVDGLDRDHKDQVDSELSKDLLL